MRYLFISDNHYFHENIIKYCNRKFSSLQEMHLYMIRKWNEKVKKEDTVIHIGDLCLSQSKEAPNAPNNPSPDILKQLNGNIILIRGNHDRNNRVKSIIESMVINHGGQKIYLTHNPQFAKENYAINLCGHKHNEYKFKKLSEKSIIINMSVEQWDYTPQDINEILKELSKWKKNGYK